MRSQTSSLRWLGRLFAGAVLIAAIASSAPAQITATNGTSCPPAPCPAPNCWAPCPTAPGSPPSAAAPSTGAPGTLPPGADAVPSISVAPESSALALSGGSVAMAAPGAYLDSAIPQTMFRLRYDDAMNINRPDRAEFLFATWKELSFHNHPIVNNGVVVGVFKDPNAQGAVQSPGQWNYQEISPYFEYAVNDRFSAFLEVPSRFVRFGGVQEGADDRGLDNKNPVLHEENEPEGKGHTGGLSDIQLGFKYALLAEPDQYLTFQFRTDVPSGDPRTGLGTGHVSLEPAVLYYKRLDRLTFQGQFNDWIPLGGGPLAGNVLSYGVGVGYDVYHCGNLCVTPITEFVGWTVLSGMESFFVPGANIVSPVFPSVKDHGVTDAAGDTIVNAKIGVRTYFGHGSDVYVGYGRALTGDRWYKDIYRVEYRYTF